LTGFGRCCELLAVDSFQPDSLVASGLRVTASLAAQQQDSAA
jgi:hypothetical protein